MSNAVTRAARRLPRGPVVNVRDGLSGRDNAMGVIRLALALAVIVSHAFPLGGWGEDPTSAWTRGQANLGDLAVLGFFAISGYLIAKSGTRGDVVTFLWHRCLRIFPAFWTVLLVTALVVGPIAWLALGRPFGGYWNAPGGPLQYVGGNALLTIKHYGISDIFADTPYGRTFGGSIFNGSLWTLRHEFFCYLIIAALVALTVMARPAVARVVVPALTLGFLVIRIGIEFGVNLGAVTSLLASEARTRLILTFLVGSCIAVYSRHLKFDDRLGGLAVAVVLVTAHYGWLGVLGVPALAYVVLWLAYRLPRSWRWIGARNDYSYGVYLYGFLFEQILAALRVYRWGYVPFVALAIVPTVGCAWLSWHGVEKHAMALKDRGPGRGIPPWIASWKRLR